jgi:hypothetical protein
MKKLYLFLLPLFFVSCSKEALQRDAVISAMTNGQWKMVRYMDDTTNLTADFAVYKFQFRDNLTVEAIRNNAVESTGSWNADAAARTITSGFGGTAAHPLPLLNGTWKITNNSWTFVEANQLVNGITRSLRLEKF